MRGDQALALGAVAASVRMVSGYPGSPSTGVFDSHNFLYGNGVSLCTGVPDFGPVGDSGVRWIRNMSALGRQYGKSVGRSSNPDITAPEFPDEIQLAAASEPGTAYYLVHLAYMGRSGHYRLISVRHEEPR